MLLKVRDTYKLKSLVGLEDVDTSKLNKKELEKHTNKVEICKKKIEVSHDVTLNELEIINNLIIDLKKSMALDDDF